MIDLVAHGTDLKGDRCKVNKGLGVIMAESRRICGRLVGGFTENLPIGRKNQAMIHDQGEILVHFRLATWLQRGSHPQIHFLSPK